MKAVFTTKIDSGYDDQLEERYHFPRTYLNQVEKAVGDQIVYYQPRRGGGELAYFGTATVSKIIEDRSNPDLFYALLEGFINFDEKVPFSDGFKSFEKILRKDDGTVNKGAFGRAVRNISDDEFRAIISAGFSSKVDWPEINDAELLFQLNEGEQATYDSGEQRPQIAFTRPFRDRAFTRQVQRAYDRRCAVTGLKLLNGGGRPEVQAAHIKPVADNGPDSIRNGLALSGTIHWLFDRGLIGFDNDFRILTVRDAIPDEIGSLINKTGRLLVPANQEERPSLNYLRFHRETIYKG